MYLDCHFWYLIQFHFGHNVSNIQWSQIFSDSAKKKQNHPCIPPKNLVSFDCEEDRTSFDCVLLHFVHFQSVHFFPNACLQRWQASPLRPVQRLNVRLPMTPELGNLSHISHGHDQDHIELLNSKDIWKPDPDEYPRVHAYPIFKLLPIPYPNSFTTRQGSG